MSDLDFNNLPENRVLFDKTTGHTHDGDNSAAVVIPPGTITSTMLSPTLLQYINKGGTASSTSSGTTNGYTLSAGGKLDINQPGPIAASGYINTNFPWANNGLISGTKITFTGSSTLRVWFFQSNDYGPGDIEYYADNVTSGYTDNTIWYHDDKLLSKNLWYKIENIGSGTVSDITIELTLATSQAAGDVNVVTGVETDSDTVDSPATGTIDLVAGVGVGIVRSGNKFIFSTAPINNPIGNTPPVPGVTNLSLTSAIDNTSGNPSVTATWSFSGPTAGVSYEVSISNYDNVAKTEGTLVYSTTTTSTSYIFYNLTPGNYYEVDVVVLTTSAQQSSATSATIQAGTDTRPPAVPTGLVVSAGLQTVIVNWNAVNSIPKAASYVVNLDTVSTFNSANLQTQTIVGGTVAGFATNIQENTTYYAEVKAISSSNVSSAYSAAASDKTGQVNTSNAPIGSQQVNFTIGGQNLLYDASFEGSNSTNISRYWTAVNGASGTWTTETSTEFIGTQAVQYSSTSTTATGTLSSQYPTTDNNGVQTMVAYTPIKASQVLSMRAYVNLNSYVVGASIQINFYDSSHTLLGTWTPLSATNGPYVHELSWSGNGTYTDGTQSNATAADYTTPANTAYLQCVLTGGYSTSGTNSAVSIFDEIMIVRGDAITSWAPNPNEVLPGTVYGDMIAANTITANSFVAGAIVANDIQARSLTADRLQTNAITATSGVIANAAITSAMINSITANQISTGTLQVGTQISLSGQSNLVASNGTTNLVLGSSGLQLWPGAINSGLPTVDINASGTAIFRGTVSAGTVDASNITGSHIYSNSTITLNAANRSGGVHSAGVQDPTALVWSISSGVDNFIQSYTDNTMAISAHGNIYFEGGGDVYTNAASGTSSFWAPNNIKFQYWNGTSLSNTNCRITTDGNNMAFVANAGATVAIQDSSLGSMFLVYHDSQGTIIQVPTGLGVQQDTDPSTANGPYYVTYGFNNQQIGYGGFASSARYKSDISMLSKGGINNPLFKIRAKEFKYNDSENWIIRPNREVQTGLIAEELYEVAPETVYANDKGEPGALYEYALIAYLVDAVNYLKAELDMVKSKV